jgi:hypothetical protein
MVVEHIREADLAAQVDIAAVDDVAPSARRRTDDRVGSAGEVDRIPEPTFQY